MKSIILLFVGIVAMIIPATQLASAQIFPIQYSQVPNTATALPPGIDPQYMTFEQFMQFMMLYKDFFGLGQDIDIKKVYKEYHDDDDDDDDDKHHKHKHNDKWWKNKDPDRDNKKKYCEGKGHWNGKTCVTDNEKDKEDWRDAVCDGGSQSKFCGGNGKDDDKDEEEEEDDTRDDESEDEGEEFDQQEDSDSNDSDESDDSDSEDSGDDSDEGDSDSDDGDDGGDDSDDGGGDDGDN